MRLKSASSASRLWAEIAQTPASQGRLLGGDPTPHPSRHFLFTLLLRLGDLVIEMVPFASAAFVRYFSLPPPDFILDHLYDGNDYCFLGWTAYLRIIAFALDAIRILLKKLPPHLTFYDLILPEGQFASAVGPR